MVLCGVFLASDMQVCVNGHFINLLYISILSKSHGKFLTYCYSCLGSLCHCLNLLLYLIAYVLEVVHRFGEDAVLLCPFVTLKTTFEIEVASIRRCTLGQQGPFGVEACMGLTGIQQLPWVYDIYCENPDGWVQ